MKLVITEKRDQVKAFVDADIGWTMKQGFATRRVDGEEWRAVWSQGHVLTLETPDEVIPDLSWQSTDKLLPIPDSYRRRVIDDAHEAKPGNSAKDRVDRIAYHMKDANEVIISTDSDREGEAIGWSILEHLNWNGPVRRLWLAAGLDPKSIREAFNDIREPERTKSYARAAEARSRSDWSFMFGVRAYTFYAKYGKFGMELAQGKGRAGTMSVGRVQTPTLGLIVRREEEIENFVSRDHFKIAADFSPLGADGSIEATYNPVVTKEVIESAPAGVHWEPSSAPPNEKGEVPLDKPLFIGKEEVDAFEKRLRDAADQAKVLSYKEGTSKSSPKKTYNITDAQGDIGKALKIKSTLVQTILEDLYEQGYMSYARTSKADLPINLHDPANRNSMLDAIAGISELKEAADAAKAIHDGEHSKYQPFTPSVYVKKDMEHYGMVPTAKEMNDSALGRMVPRKKSKSGKVAHTSDMMKKAYLMVCKRYLHAMLPPAEFATQSVSFSVPVKDMMGADEAVFRASARRLNDPGYAAFFDVNLSESSDLPTMKNGDGAELKGVSLSASKTKPPGRYTTTSLPQAMEDVAKEIRDPNLRKLLKSAEGLGTAATRSQVIETLEARNYIEVVKENYYPTKRGRDLIKSVPEWMSSPETSAVWEDHLAQMCEEKDDNVAVKMRDEFVVKQTKMLEEVIQELKDKYDSNLGERVGGGGGGVTPKMKKAIQKIAELKGLTVDDETLKSPDKARAFLDEHIGENAPPLPPSPKQLDLALRVFEAIGGDVTKEDLEKSGKACSQYIDDNLEAFRKIAKPSEAQKKFAEDLAEKLPEDKRPDPKIFETAAGCSKFIDEQTGNSKKGGGKKGGSRAKTGRSGRGGAPTRRRRSSK